MFDHFLTVFAIFCHFSFFSFFAFLQFFDVLIFSNFENFYFDFFYNGEHPYMVAEQSCEKRLWYCS